MGRTLLVSVLFFACLAGATQGLASYRQYNNKTQTLRYRCQSPYKRIGNRCYFLSLDKLSWRDSQFSCTDLNHGYLAKVDKNWKDRKLRNFLRKSREPNERWIGSIYDDKSRKWIWAQGGEALRYQGFSQRRPYDNYKWRCVSMNPSLFFRWSTRSCLSTNYYICEIPIQIIVGRKEQMRRNRERNRIKSGRNKYQSSFETNKIT